MPKKKIKNPYINRRNLKDTLEQPGAECGEIKFSSFLQGFIEIWVGQGGFFIHILVQHQTKDRQGGKDRGVAQHQIPIVNSDRDKKEHT